jgi:putative acetyltransferase
VRPAVTIRDVRDSDGPAMLRILAAVFAEYEGCYLDESEVPELAQPASSARAAGAKIWLAEANGSAQGFVALWPAEDARSVELRKLYVARQARGTGLGRRLIECVENEARKRGARRVHLWSDTRFLTAHQVYAHLGYVRLPETRELHDVSHSVEYHYEKILSG